MILRRTALPLALLVAGTAAPDAGAFVYWANSGNGTIGRARLDGGSVNQGYIAGASQPCGVFTDATETGGLLLWANAGSGTIGGAAVDGAGRTARLNESRIRGLSGPCGFDGANWADQGDGTIERATIDDTGAVSEVNRTLITGASAPCGVKKGGSIVLGGVLYDTLYWANSATGTIGRAAVDIGTHRVVAGSTNQSFIPGAGDPCGVAVATNVGGTDRDTVYWANRATGTIGRAVVGAADGSTISVDQSFVPGAGQSCGVDFEYGVALGGGSGLGSGEDALYWADRASGAIGHAIINDRSGAVVRVQPRLVTGAAAPCGVTADSLPYTPAKCHARAHPVRDGSVHVDLTCADYSFDGFGVSADRKLGSVWSPDSEFDCSRITARSFGCNDIHSGLLSSPPVAVRFAQRCHGGRAHPVLTILVSPGPLGEAHSPPPPLRLRVRC